MKSRAACRRAKARCWLSTPRRAWRRRRSRTPILRCNHNLEIIPVINKIDLPSAEPERIREQIEQVIGLDASDAVLASAKQGIGIEEILEAVVQRVPPPKGDPDAPLRALIFDSWFDPYRGVIILMRVVEGRLRMGQKIRLWSNGRAFMRSKASAINRRNRFLATNCRRAKRVSSSPISRPFPTRRSATRLPMPSNPAAEPLPGFEEIKPMVFAGLYPVESHEHGLLRDALEKLRLNDSAFNFEPENSVALGFGFRCGFLGLLHLEIIQERLEREFNIDLITTAPGVRYRVTTDRRRSDRGR